LKFDTVQRKRKPNTIPLFERVVSLLLALGLMLYGFAGLLKGRFSVSFVKARPGLFISGRPAWLLAAAALAGALVLLSVVLDHYDRRDNECQYRIFRRIWLCVGLVLFLSAVGSGFYAGLVG
jgi:hypothetical protein